MYLRLCLHVDMFIYIHIYINLMAYNAVKYDLTSVYVYPASRGFSLVFLSVVLPFSSLFWLLAFCFGCFCAEEKTSADSRLDSC